MQCSLEISCCGRAARVMLAALRIALGCVFLYAGWSKIVVDSWSAKAYLLNATGPFKEFFMGLAGNATVDWLNMWGLTLIGVALILGLLVRFASFWGVVMMMLYYFSDFAGNTAHGIIDEHIMYALILVFFMVSGAGFVFGLDTYFERTYFLQKYPVLKWLFG